MSGGRPKALIRAVAVAALPLLLAAAASRPATRPDFGIVDLAESKSTVSTLAADAGRFRVALDARGVPKTLTVDGPAELTGTTGFVIDTAAAESVTPGTYELIAAKSGLGGPVNFVGGQNLTVPATASIQTIAGKPYRLSLASSDKRVTLTISPAPARVLRILPMGSSITAGQSAQTHFDGAGYRSQLWQRLVNDGRVTPEFVGGVTTTQSHNPTGPNLLMTVGQLRHEGHPGYRTDQVLGNLNGNENSRGNNGGYWLKPGNGVEPDIITLNVGGNDYVKKNDDMTAIDRLDQILTQLHELRPKATIFVSNIVTRTDAKGAIAHGFETLYNPLIPVLVAKHAKAGEPVRFVDLASKLTPADLSGDKIHPTQAGYNKMADLWFEAVAAYLNEQPAETSH